MKASRKLAQCAIEQSSGYKYSKYETVEVKKSAIIQLSVDNLTTYEGIEGVRIKRTPKPSKVESTCKEDMSVKRMFVMADLTNESCHVFNNVIILN